MYEPEYTPPLCYYGLNVEKPNYKKTKKYYEIIKIIKS